MKKIFYILASAIVALGAVACENEGLDNVNPENNVKGEGLTITATVDEATKVAFEGLTPSWEEGDKLFIGEYEFTFTEGNSFTCEKDGVFSLCDGTKKEITAGEFNSSNGLKGSAWTAQSVIEREGTVVELKLTTALLKVTAAADKTVLKSAVFSNEEVALTKGIETYVPIWRGDNSTVTYFVDGVECKSITTNFVAGQVYNLGELKAPVGLCYKGSWDSWTNLRGMFSEGDYYVAKNVVCPANTTFKFVIKSSGVMMGATSATTSLGTWNAFANNDIKIATAGTYNIYVSKNSGAWCVVKSTTSVPALNNKKYLYLIPSSGWESDGAKFGAWCYGGSAANADKNFTWAMYENDNNYHYLDVTGYKQFYIKRLSSDGNSTWNEVGPITIGDNTLVTITGWNATSYTATSLIP